VEKQNSFAVTSAMLGIFRDNARTRSEFLELIKRRSDVLQGVRYRGAGASTESLVMRSRSGTVRRIQATHDRAKLRAVIGERYG